MSRSTTQRAATYEADHGRCVGCGAKQGRNAGTWAWHCHHVIKAQTLRRQGVRVARIRDATFTVLLCRRCHERHESVTARVPFENLPARVVVAVDALGPWAEDLLRKYHPPSAGVR